MQGLRMSTEQPRWTAALEEMLLKIKYPRRESHAKCHSCVALLHPLAQPTAKTRYPHDDGWLAWGVAAKTYVMTVGCR